jgi:hypothetical protein
MTKEPKKYSVLNQATSLGKSVKMVLTVLVGIVLILVAKTGRMTLKLVILKIM